MALTFGKINRAASFNPTTAFPLDARGYFESYDLAVAAALTAKEAGDTTTVYYYGETVAVVENGVASLYIIQPDGTLSPVGSDVEVSVNENAFTFTDGKIDLLGFADAVAGAQLVKSEDGKISWVKPDATTVEGLQTTITTLETNVTNLTETVNNKADITTVNELTTIVENKANAADVYTKAETDTAIATAIADIDHLKRIVVDNVDAEIAAPELANKNVIYMVKVSDSGDAYKEYMRFDAEDGTVTFEQIGDTSVDLSDYVNNSELENALADKANVSTTDALAALIQANTTAIESKANQSDLAALQETVEGHGTDITALQESKVDIQTLTALEEKVDKNASDIAALTETVNNKADITTVDSLQTLVTTKANQSDLEALVNTVNNKVDIVYSEVDGEQVAWTLLSPTNAAKLEKLSISEDGSVGISGTVSVDNVQGLADWITSKRDTVAGLFSTTYQTKLDGIDAGAEVNVIEAIKLAGQTDALAITDKTVEIPYASDSIPGLIKTSSELALNSDNQLEVLSLNVNKLVQTEDLLLNCGGAEGFTYS